MDIPWRSITASLIGLGLIIAFPFYYWHPKEQAALDHYQIAKNRMNHIKYFAQEYYQENQQLPVFTSGKTYSPIPNLEMRLTFTPDEIATNIHGRLCDPFRKKEAVPFGIFQRKDNVLLFSIGPDNNYSLNPKQWFDKDTTEQSDKLLSKSYDPTNGAFSDGDIYHVFNLNQVELHK